MRKSIVVRVLALSLLGGALAPTTGCAASLATLIITASSYLTYVNTFVTVAEGVWNAISALLPPSSQAAASSQFEKAVNDVGAACAALSEAIAAAKAADSPSPNLQALINDCVSAVDEVVSAIAQYQTAALSSGKVGTSAVPIDTSVLAHMQTVIHTWKH